MRCMVEGKRAEPLLAAALLPPLAVPLPAVGRTDKGPT